MRFLIPIIFFQISISFGSIAGGAAAALSGEENSVVVGANPVEQTYSPLEQRALLILNSAHALFEGKTFREMDDARKAQFTTDFTTATDTLSRFCVFEGLMREGFIDGFDRALLCLQRANSFLAKYMVLFSFLARAQGVKDKYPFPPNLLEFLILSDQAYVQQNLNSSIPKDAFLQFFVNTLISCTSQKTTDRNLSAYFAFCMNKDSYFLKHKYAFYVFSKVINHRFDGIAFPDFASACNYAGRVYYDLIIQYKRSKSTPWKTNHKKLYQEILSTFITFVLKIRSITEDPRTRRNFSNLQAACEFLGTLLTQEELLEFPTLAARLKDDPKERIDLLCSKLNELNSIDLMFLASEIGMTQYLPIEIARLTSEAFSISNPTILDIKAFLLKKAYDLKTQYQDLALVQLCYNCARRRNASLLPRLGESSASTIVNHLSIIVSKEERSVAFYEALYLLKWFRDQTGYALEEKLDAFINEKTSFMNPEYPNEYKIEDAKICSQNPSFCDLPYLERLLEPVLEDEDLKVQAYQILYDLSLKINNMEKALEYATQLHRITSFQQKNAWREVKQTLERLLHPPARPSQHDVSLEAQERARQLLAEQTRREEEEHQEWVQRQLELRELYKQQHPEVKAQTLPKFDRLPSLQFEIAEDARIAKDLEQEIFRTSPALKANYDRVVEDLKAGRKPCDNSKYTGTFVVMNGKQYPLWHCRLNDEHRVFYYKIGTDVYIIQAFGHNFNSARLPH